MDDFKYRPLAALISGGTVVVVDVLVAVLDLYVNGPASFLGSLPLYLLVLWIVFVFLFKPSVKVTKDSISITNPFRWIQISISDVVDIETKRGLVLKTKEADFPVAVGVAPGRYTVARANKSDFKWAGSHPRKDVFVVSPSDIIDAFQIVDTKFGSNINYQPSVEKYVRLTKGTYNSMIIYLTDQNNNPITLKDNNLLITLLFKKII
jgi:AAA+ ATPase superfamily predicted ATPase